MTAPPHKYGPLTGLGENELLHLWWDALDDTTRDQIARPHYHRLLMARYGDYSGEDGELLEATLIHVGVLKPDEASDAGAEEYEMLTKGEEIWASIQKNSEN